MKKLLLVLMLLLSTQLVAFSKEQGTPIDFIYIHGANKSELGGRPQFDKEIHAMNKAMKANFEKNDFIRHTLLLNAYINEEPQMLYWGDSLLVNKELIKTCLKIADKSSAGIPQIAREIIAVVVHDAVWLQKNNHMVPMINELHKQVMANYAKGEKTVIVGYSAGTFISNDYALSRLKSLNPAEAMEYLNGRFNVTNKDVELVKKYAPKSTCAGALVAANLLKVDDTGMIHLNSNASEREQAYKKLQNTTSAVCAPDDAVVGIINWGCPFVVFYSDFAVEGSLQRYIIMKTMQHAVENNKFYLTVNYTKDPIAVPLPNFTFDKLSNMVPSKDLKKGNGFIYDTFIVGGRNTGVSHTFYWEEPNHYTKKVAKAYQKGYDHFYQIDKK